MEKILLFLLLSYSSVTDLCFRRISKRAIVGTCVVWVAQKAYREGVSAIPGIFFSIVILYAAGITIWYVTGIGAGDIRLLVSMTLLMGMSEALEITVYGFLAAGAYVAVQMTFLRRGSEWMNKMNESLPFAVFLLLGYGVYLTRLKFGI